MSLLKIFFFPIFSLITLSLSQSFSPANETSHSPQKESDSEFQDSEEVAEITDFQTVLLLKTNKTKSELQEIFTNPTYAQQLKRAKSSKGTGHKPKNYKQKQTQIVRTFKNESGDYEVLVDKYSFEGVEEEILRDIDDLDELPLDDFKVKSNHTANLLQQRSSNDQKSIGLAVITFLILSFCVLYILDKQLFIILN